MPVDWLVRDANRDAQRYPSSSISTPSQIREAKRNLGWARRREEVIAGAAAGIHLALFSFNLAFYGFEGMPPDRYNPPNLRCVHEERALCMGWHA